MKAMQPGLPLIALPIVACDDTMSTRPFVPPVRTGSDLNAPEYARAWQAGMGIQSAGCL